MDRWTMKQSRNTLDKDRDFDGEKHDHGAGRKLFKIHAPSRSECDLRMLNQPSYIHLVRKMIAKREGVHGFGGEIVLDVRSLNRTHIPNAEVLADMLNSLMREEVPMGSNRIREKLLTNFRVEDGIFHIDGTRTDRLKIFLQQMIGRDPRTHGARRSVGSASHLDVEPLPGNDWANLRLTLFGGTHLKVEYKDSRGQLRMQKPDISCDEIGLGSRKRSVVEPGVLWNILMSIAGRSGILDYEDPSVGSTANNRKKNKSMLKKTMQRLFHTAAANDPFKKITRSTFKTKFECIYDSEPEPELPGAIRVEGNQEFATDGRDSRFDGEEDAFR